MSKTAEALVAKSAQTSSSPQPAQTIALAVSAAADQATPYLYRLPNIFPYIWPILRPIFISTPKAIFTVTFNVLYVPTAYIIHFLGMLFAPIFLLLRITFDLFIAAPVNAIVWVVNLLYPIYVFVCVAALVGALLGLVGVGIGKAGLYLVNSGREPESVGDMGHAAARARIIQERDREWERERETSLKGKEREREVPATTITIPAPIPGRPEAQTTIKIEEDVNGSGSGSTRRGRRVEFVD